MRNECSNGHELRWFLGSECPDCGRAADFTDDPDEQERRWAALDASVPCSHTIPGTCDYC